MRGKLQEIYAYIISLLIFVKIIGSKFTFILINKRDHCYKTRSCLDLKKQKERRKEEKKKKTEVTTSSSQLKMKS